MRNVAVIISSRRQGRFGDKPAQWVLKRLEQEPDVTVDLIDLRDYDLPHYDSAKPPSRRGREYDTDDVRRFAERIDRADAYVILAAEYNHGYTGALKSAMDHTFVEWNRKPITFVGWGAVGGARAIEQLRQVAVEYEMVPLRHAVHILPDVFFPAFQAPEPFDTAVFAPLDGRLDALVRDLLWWCDALAAARQPSTV